MKRILGPVFLTIVVIIVTTSLIGCVNDKPCRYQIIFAGGITELMDIKTLDVYYSYDAKWHRITPQGAETVVCELPE